MSERITCQIIQQDITKLQNVDAIVNAANDGLLPGGGVCGAIFRAAGNGLNKECQLYIQSHGRLPVSGAVTTDSYNLTKQGIQKIIHVVGPIYHQSKNPIEELRQAIRNIYKEAFEIHNLSSVAIPAVSSGIYGFPKDLCAKAFKDTMLKGKDIRLVNFDAETYNIFGFIFAQKLYKWLVTRQSQIKKMPKGSYQITEQQFRRFIIPRNVIQIISICYYFYEIQQKRFKKCNQIKKLRNGYSISMIQLFRFLIPSENFSITGVLYWFFYTFQIDRLKPPGY